MNSNTAWYQTGKRATDSNRISLPSIQTNLQIEPNKQTLNRILPPKLTPRSRSNPTSPTLNSSTTSAPFSNFKESINSTSTSPNSNSNSNKSNNDFDRIPIRPDRAHLHYRDEELDNNINLPYPQTIHYDQSKYPANDEGIGNRSSFGKESEAMAAALEASRYDISNSSASREELELQKALAESSRLARSQGSNQPVRSDSTDSDLQRVLAESRVSALSSSNPYSPKFQNSSGSSSLEASEWKMRARNEKGRLWQEAGAHLWVPPGARTALGPDEEERLMLELAIRISLEEEEEARKRNMNDVEYKPVEERERLTPPPLPSRNRDQASSPPTLPRRPLPPIPAKEDFLIASTPSPNSLSPRTQQISFIAPSRPKIFSYPPVVDEEGSSPREYPYLESFTSAKENQTESSANSTQGTEELSLNQQGGTTELSSDSDALDSRRGSSESTYESSSDQAEEASTITPSTSNIKHSLSIRNPDTTTNSRQQTQNAVFSEDLSTEGKFSPYRNSIAGRSMSLISERTEPNQSTTSLSEPETYETTRTHVVSEPEVEIINENENEGTEEENFPSNSTPSSGSFKVGTDSEKLNVGASPTLLARLEREKNERLDGSRIDGINNEQNSSRWSTDSSANKNHSNSQSSPVEVEQLTLPTTLSNNHEISSNLKPPPAQVEEVSNSDNLDSPLERITFGDGIRFGFGAPCSEEIDHSCSTDGLRNDEIFPKEIVLSNNGISGMDALRKFSIEANSFTKLLRFLMWYGDTTIKATNQDVENSETKHCESSLSLGFRKNDEGIYILRLTITLLFPDQSLNSHELQIVSPTSPTAALPPNSKIFKGKSKATTSNTNFTSSSISNSPIFELPDQLILPCRLNQIAITLYTLRQLANIAASTLPAKEASISYHNLRSLALAIDELNKEHESLKDNSQHEGQQMNQTAVNNGEDRLITRLKDRIKKLGGSSGNGGGSKKVLLKAPPLVSRTTNLNRAERVLTSDDRTDRTELGTGVLVSYEAEQRVGSERENLNSSSRGNDLRYLPQVKYSGV